MSSVIGFSFGVNDQVKPWNIFEILTVLSVAEIDRPLVKRAITTQKDYRISYWDSLIVATAEREGCKKILSEDLNDGQRYNGVLVENPFSRRPV